MKNRGDAFMWLFYAACAGWLGKILWDEHQREQRARHESLQRQISYLVAEVAKLNHPEMVKAAAK